MRPSRRRLLAAIACALAVSCRHAPASPADPLLILVSIDGWRWDYTDRPGARRIRDLAARGVRVAEMIPVFPVLTFPNHYTIVTGLYPEHHGIVANSIVDPQAKKRFSMTTAEKTNPMWWGGEPIWVTAGKQGRRTAALFWPGSEGEVGGLRPTYWKPYDSKMPAEARVRQVIDWMRLPGEQQPALICAYFEDVDHAGHDYGPDSPELSRAAAVVDRAVGEIVDAIAALHLEDRATTIVVSDHGMSAVTDDRVIWLDDYVDLLDVDVTDWDGTILLAPKAGRATVEELYGKLRSAHPRLHVYTRETIPARLHYSGNPRIAPIVGIPDPGWAVSARARAARRRAEGRPPIRGEHGYDPDDRDMHALFAAAGPELKRGLVVPTLANIDVYELLCRILKLTPAPNDGSAAATSAFFEVRD
jgi:predicted AlkP superfamily pyrophosphatase or phosphodiesterase